MKYILIFFTLTSFSAFPNTSFEPVKDHVKNHGRISLGYSSLQLPNVSSSDAGLAFSYGYFLLSNLSLNGQYFLTSNFSGASNMNGFNLKAKYYFYNTETSFEMKHGEAKIRSYDSYFAYASFQFLDREIRTSRVNINYTGFGASLGAGYKLNYHSSIGLDALVANLQTPSGATTKNEAHFTNLSFFYSRLF